MKRHLMVAATAATIGIASLGAGAASAATNESSTKADPMSSLVDKIASKFSLNKTEVQQVFDEQRTAMEAEREQNAKDRLAQLVKDGKLSQAQADAITAKRAELQKQRETNKDEFKNMSEADRKAAMDKRKAELEAWAKEQGIDTQYLRLVMGGGPGHGHGHGGPRGGEKPTNQ